jgi:Lon-like ATP-dependent protease
MLLISSCCSCCDAFVDVFVKPSLCREAGVRNLKKQLEKIYRKAALKLVQTGAVPEARPAGEGEQQQQQQAEQEDNQQRQPEVQPEGNEQAHPDGGVQQADTLSATDSLVREVMGRSEPASTEPDVDQPPSAGEQDRGSRAQQLAEGAEGAAATVFAEPVVVIDAGDLKEYVGQPPYPTDKIYAEGTPAGEAAADLPCTGIQSEVLLGGWLVGRR